MNTSPSSPAALFFTLSFLASCTTTPATTSSWQIPQNGLLNEYINPELARFYPEPPAVSPDTLGRLRADAEAGDSDARVQLGMLYLTGRAVEKDPDVA